MRLAKQEKGVSKLLMNKWIRRQHTMQDSLTKILQLLWLCQINENI